MASGLTICWFLNDEPCMVRRTLIDMNTVEIKYYSFTISLNKRTGSCNILILKIWVTNVKVFNIITNKDEAKAMTEHILCDYRYKFNSTTCNSKQKSNNKTSQCECKNNRQCKEDYSWNPSICFFLNSKYLKSIVDNSVPEYYNGILNQQKRQTLY